MIVNTYKHTTTCIPTALMQPSDWEDYQYSEPRRESIKIVENKVRREQGSAKDKKQRNQKNTSESEITIRH